ncbi:facilitated trehalose transporter Tret1-like [Pollicipes pollicipes]|uniref:facilitated trehalose transporter Tret1-like n=1 Tax=Pollicipes pollicipes TaxID=41117 RepID=UPI001884A7BB|nr:facilitated trehalose transporter Tret1-like [Pollicipes pollicipes]
MASVSQMLCGMSSGFTSPALPELRHQMALSSRQESLISALQPLGAMVGGPLAALALDRIGRKATFMLVAVLFTAGWLAVSYAGSAAPIMAGRLVQGLGCGGSFLALPNYIGEVSEPRVRGLLGMFTQIGFCCGTLFEFIVGKYVAWNWLALMSATVSAAWLPCITLLPESPLYLVMRRKEQAAAAALRRLRGPRYDVPRELAEVTRYARDVLRRHPASGTDALTFFTVDILEAAGSSMEPHTATACTATLGLYFYLLRAGHDLSGVGWLPLACLLIFNPAFAIGLGLVPWIVIGEMFAPEMRGMGASVGTTITSLITTLITLCFNSLKSGLTEAGTFWLFSAITAVGALYPIFFVYETKGKSLDQITEHFKQSDGPAEGFDSRGVCAGTHGGPTPTHEQAGDTCRACDVAT